jgi:NADH-quinone oxidoreductase subunit M
LLLVTFSSVGLPGLNGFVGEFLIFLGAFAVSPGWTAAAATGMILGAIYMLWMLRRVIFGPLTNP